MNRRTRLVAFVVVAVFCLAGVGAYGAHVLRRDDAAERGRTTAAAAGAPRVTALAHQPRIIFRSTLRGPSYGLVSMVPFGDPTAAPAATGLQCDRIDQVADGRGICLAASPGIYSSFKAFAFDANLKVLHGFPVTGVPSRARVSPDGTLGAVTTFIAGHSYATNNFSTATTVYDLDQGRTLGNLESFTILRDGKRITPADANFWGVTFARDDDTFYATLATGGVHYLVRGSLKARTVRTVTTGVECPSLSPDETRVAFKSRLPGKAVKWRLAVVDLKTLAVTDLAETRNVDDQPGWYDDSTVSYGLVRADDGTVEDTWLTPANGTGTPRVLVKGAWSAAFVR